MFVRLCLECFSSAVLSSGVRHLSFASSVVFDVACSASDLAWAFSPLPQVHPGKWYPSVGTWTLRKGCLGKLGWTSGRRQPDQSLYLTPKIFLSLRR